MSILWMESFNYYGLDETKMLDGLWAQIAFSGFASPPSLSTTRARTGTHSLFMPDVPVNSAQNVARRVFGGAKSVVGVGMALYLEALPDTNDQLCFLRLADAANAEQISFYIQSTGIIAAYRGVTFLEDTGSPVITADAWNHVEVKAKIHNSTGYLEVRVNEVTVLNLTGIDTQSTALAETSQMEFGKINSSVSGSLSTSWYVDDIFTWDDQVDGDNDIVDFVGDKKVFTVFPNADTAEADWAKSTGTVGYSLIDEENPDDADYITTATDGDVSEFGLQDLPSNIAEIIAVQITPRVLKTDAGTVLFSTDIVSGASATAADPIPLTTQATYRPFIHTKDPASGVPFTLSDFDAAKVRVSRPAP